MAVAVGRARTERHGVLRRRLESDADGDALLAGIHIALEVRGAESGDAHLVLESGRVHRRREVDPHAVARRVLVAVDGRRVRDRRLPDGGERRCARIRAHAAVGTLQTLVHGDRVARLHAEPLARIPRKDRAGVVPLEGAGRDRAVGGVLDAEPCLRRRVHRLVERDVDLLPRAAVDPVRVGLDRVDAGHDRREGRAPVLLEHAIGG